MDTNRIVAVVMVLVLLAVGAGAIGMRLFGGDSKPGGFESSSRSAEPVAPGNVPDVQANRTAELTLADGRPLGAVAEANRPPEPRQWNAGGPVRSNTWWSSAVAGPGAESLWPQPLALRVDPDGKVFIANPSRQRNDDGSTHGLLGPEIVLDLGSPAQLTVVDHGSLHVVLRLVSNDGRSARITLLQGSPLVEIETADLFSLSVPGLETTRTTTADESADKSGDQSLAGPTTALESDGGTALSRSARFETGWGQWMLEADRAVGLDRAAEQVDVSADGPTRLVLGPLPDRDDGRFELRARTMAEHPLVATSELIQVADDGTTTQTLIVERAGAQAPDRTPVPLSLWALQPHHQRYRVGVDSPLGELSSSRGPLPVVSADRLVLRYPAVPLLWSAVPVEPPGEPSTLQGSDLPVESSGSYFGGKHAYATAALGDVYRSAGDPAAAEAAMGVASFRLDDLVSAVASPSLRWDDTWGSVILEPAEFASGSELNDHQLQYGYWVAAASLVADADPDAVDRYRAAIDLLIADYAGAATVPDATDELPAERTWSPYAGHSWASGLGAFASGNNLESISESSFAWWAAARWFLSSGRPDAAEVFVGRFTIESALTAQHWLPAGEALPIDSSHRPWSGVVWAGKVDNTTWFDPAHESALGIRLLPVSPASLARYGSADALAASESRWRWCDDHGDGCTRRWANLLDSDAVVAGRPVLAGPEPEPSTSRPVSAWWRTLWDATTPLLGWRCSPGVVPRESGDGVTVVLASNPSPVEAAMTCQDPSGTTRWSGSVAPRSASATRLVAPGEVVPGD